MDGVRARIATIAAGILGSAFPASGDTVREVRPDGTVAVGAQRPYTADAASGVCSVVYFRGGTEWFAVSRRTLESRFGMAYHTDPNRAVTTWLVQVTASPSILRGLADRIARLKQLDDLVRAHGVSRLVVAELAKTSPVLTAYLPAWEAAVIKMDRIEALINKRPLLLQQQAPAASAPTGLLDSLRRSVAPLLSSPIGSLWDLVTSGQIAIAAFLLLRGSSDVECVLREFRTIWMRHIESSLFKVAADVARSLVSNLIPANVQEEIAAMLVPTKQARCLLYAIAVLVQTRTGGLYTPAVASVLDVTESECAGAVYPGRVYTVPSDAIGLAVRATLLYRDSVELMAGARSAVDGLYAELAFTQADRDAVVSRALKQQAFLEGDSVRSMHRQFTSALTALGGADETITRLTTWCPAVLVRLSVYAALVATGYTGECSADAVFVLYLRMEAPMMGAAYELCRGPARAAALGDILLENTDEAKRMKAEERALAQIQVDAENAAATRRAEEALDRAAGAHT